MVTQEEVVNKRKELIKSFFRGEGLLLIISVLIIAAIFKVYLFFHVGNQPIWWDEGDYLSLAKFWSVGVPFSDGMSYLLGMRPFFLSLIGALFFRVGLGESSIRFFFELIPSITSVFIIYLIGKELYGKWAGVTSSVMAAFYWVWNFYSLRIMTDIPSTFFSLLSIYFFLVVYEKRGFSKGFYLSIIFGVLAFFTRFPQALVLVTIFVYLAITKKFSLLKDKTIIRGVLLLLLLLLPYFIYLFSIDFAPLKIYFGSSSTTITNPIAWKAISMLFGFSQGNQLLHSSWMILAVIGVISLIPLVIGLDIVWKQQNKVLNNDFFISLWVIIQVFFFVFIIRSFEDRWLLLASMGLFVIASKGFVFLESFLRKYIKSFAIIICFALLLIGVYQNINHSNDIINSRITSYIGVKDAGLWLKENSPVGTKVITASIVQNYYYSDRESHNLMPNVSEFPESCFDKSKSIIGSPECSKAWELSFNKKVLNIKPSYFIISVYEPAFTPQWAYDYSQRNNLTFVKAFFQPEDLSKPVLIIYKFPENYSPVKL